MFLKKLQSQDNIPTFFDNLVHNQLISDAKVEEDYCRIFECGMKSKSNRFISLHNRLKNIPQNYEGGRLLGTTPFAISQGLHSVITWKGYSLFKTSFDLVIYWMMMHEIKPDTIIEFGSGDGGSAMWFNDIANALGLTTTVISYDLKKPNLKNANITFIEFDLNDVTCLDDLRPR